MASEVQPDRPGPTGPHDFETYCADQVRRHDSDRYATSLFAPAPARTALQALYAFNIEIARTREAVSQPMLGAIRLQWWRETLDGVFAGEPRHHAVALALAEAVQAHGLERGPFERLIDARETDLEDGPPETLAALEDYAEATGGELTLPALQALGVRSAAAADAGRAVGSAWALTGLLRAIPFHARAKRLYLPADIIRAAGVSTEDLFALRPHPALNWAVEQVADLARRRLAAARALRPEVPRAALPALMPATLASGYLGLLRRAGYDPFDLRVAAALPSRSWRLLWTAASGRY